MRKAEPNLVARDFRLQLRDLHAYFRRVRQVLDATPTRKADVSTLAEQVFVTASVALEGFFSDWFIAAVNRDSSAIQNEYENRIKEQTKSKYGIWFSERVQLQRVSHVPMGDLRAVLDSKGFNVTFSSITDLKSKAATHLVNPYRNKVEVLSEADSTLVDTTKAIRDYIVHRSDYSSSRMNDALASISAGGVNVGLGRGAKKISNVGAFLKVKCGDNTRLEVYLVRMMLVTRMLRIEL